MIGGNHMNPVIAVPMGDPNGIGPEIALKALCLKRPFECASPYVAGDAGILKKVKQCLGIKVEIRLPKDLQSAEYSPGIVNVRQVDGIDPAGLRMGEVQGLAGKAAFACIKAAAEDALGGKADAIATAPINKESLKAGGVNFIGHTEILASLTDTFDPLTMFEVKGLRVFFLSRHVSLEEAIRLCTKDRILSYIKRCSEALRQLGVNGGTMAVAGLNPHCGEHGLFGHEEVESIEPAVLEAKACGYDVAGPIGADSVFSQALNGKYNSVLSLYHDQGHIATKTLDFERTISLTIGMPFLRTSVDHGTALDIAGKGIASEVSMVEAIALAGKYARAYSMACVRNK
jgi:4-hydroxythreonine-4-phosphate dehydrogenase